MHLQMSRATPLIFDHPRRRSIAVKLADSIGGTSPRSFATHVMRAMKKRGTARGAPSVLQYGVSRRGHAIRVEARRHQSLPNRQSIFDRLSDQIEASILRYQTAVTTTTTAITRASRDDEDDDEQVSTHSPRMRTCVKRAPHACLARQIHSRSNDPATRSDLRRAW